MRSLAILLLAACSSSSNPKPAEVDLAARDRCPVGDQTHVEVYGFLERELGEAEGERAEAKEQLAYEAKLVNDPQMKPQRSGITEGETSHILTTMCAGTPGCKAIALYSRAGFAIALTSNDSHVAPLGFADDARWAKLSTAAAGTSIEMTATEQRDAGTPGVWVVFPVDGALAACIVTK